MTRIFTILMVVVLAATSCKPSKGELIDKRENALFKIEQLKLRMDEAKNKIPLEKVQQMTIEESVKLELQLERPYLDSIVRMKRLVDSINLEISKY
jgi:hypothetical protein